MRLFRLLFISFLLIYGVSAQERPGRWLVDGKPTADSDWSKAKNGFGAQLIVVGDPKAFIEMWNRPEQPDIHTAKEVTKGQQFGAFIIFVACRAGKNGDCDAAVDFTVVGPDGKTVAERPNQIIWNGPPLDSKTMYMGKAVLGLKLTERNTPGKYTILAKVADKNAPASFELKYEVELKPNPNSNQ